MNRITYEYIAKWIASVNGVTLHFSDKEGACANMKTNEITLPNNLKEQNIFAALALLMHEAAHLKHSKNLPMEQLVKGKIDHNILNCLEDIRIDLKNYQVLPNIFNFYEILVKEMVLPRASELIKEDLMTRVLINGILVNTNQPRFEDVEAVDFSHSNNVNSIMMDGVRALEDQDWATAKSVIDAIKKLFNVDEKDNTPEEQEQGEGKEGEGKEGEGVEGKSKVGGGVDKYLHPGSAFDKGESITGSSKEVIGDIAFSEQMKNEFKKLLNIKEKKVISCGNKLNTNDLSAFFTGDLDELFIEDKVTYSKKSKIAFCIDSSGSMGCDLMDGQSRKSVALKVTRSITEILKEVQSYEGLNISYDIWAFDYNAVKLGDDWEAKYRNGGGGTHLATAFKTVQSDMLKNTEIDGNKMIILITDGEVDKDEIEELRQHILHHGAEVKCLVVGIGANILGDFVKNIIGDHNILGEEMGDAVLLDAIKIMEE